MNSVQRCHIVEKEVFGLDVAVDDLLGVEIVENKGGLEKPLEHLLSRERSGSLFLYTLVHIAF